MRSTLGEFQETASQDAFALQNSKLLKVSLDQITIQAKAGSMVAYQGDVAFEHAGSGGMSRMLKKAVSGEGTTLMKMSGSGEVFLADTAQEIHLLYLENDAITVNGQTCWLRLRYEGPPPCRRARLWAAAWSIPSSGTGWLRSSPTATRVCSHRAPPLCLRRGDHWASSVQTSIKTT